MKYILFGYRNIESENSASNMYLMEYLHDFEKVAKFALKINNFKFNMIF